MKSKAIKRAEERGRILYAGDEVPHRSCGIAIAETFGRETLAYQSLRRGGLTGKGECGAVVAGRLVLGELYGDHDPTGVTTDELVRAIEQYDDALNERFDRGAAPGTDRICNTLTCQFASFRSEARHRFCTAIASTVAGAVAQAMTHVSGDASASEYLDRQGIPVDESGLDH